MRPLYGSLGVKGLTCLKQLVMGSRRGPHNFNLPLLTLFERIPSSWNVSVTLFFYFTESGYVRHPPTPHSTLPRGPPFDV